MTACPDLPDDQALAECARALGRELVERRLLLATAESCTGGWIAKTVTDLAGSSEWFECGIVAYGNASKQRLLGVDAATLASHGAVSRETVLEMVAGALGNSIADIAVAVTGIAGPGGGTADKPIGTVWLAWQMRGGEAVARAFRFEGDRDAVRRLTVATAMQGLRGLLDG